MVRERYCEDANVGDECTSPSVMVTEAMIRGYADIAGDHSRIHLDEDFAKTTRLMIPRRPHAQAG